MKGFILILILCGVLFYGCNRPKITKDTLMGAYLSGWSDGFNAGCYFSIWEENPEYIKSQMKIDKSLFYLKYHEVFEYLPSSNGWITPQVNDTIVIIENNYLKSYLVYPIGKVFIRNNFDSARYINCKIQYKNYETNKN